MKYRALEHWKSVFETQSFHVEVHVWCSWNAKDDHGPLFHSDSINTK